VYSRTVAKQQLGKDVPVAELLEVLSSVRNVLYQSKLVYQSFPNFLLSTIIFPGILKLVFSLTIFLVRMKVLSVCVPFLSG
jgi:hypothetical protein